MKVLVVDDEQLVRWFLERALKKWGHEVESVSNSADALKRIGGETFDVLFTDLRMPGGNGALLVKAVSEMPQRPKKIVVCSAYISQDMADNFKELGIITLKKPFKLAELEATIKSCELEASEQ